MTPTLSALFRTRRATALALLVLSLASLGCNRGKKGGAAAVEEDPALAVQTITAAHGDLRKVVELSGTLQGEAEVDLPAQAHGVVKARLVPEGAPVTMGTALLKIDDALLQSQLRAARADLASAQALLDRARNGSRDEEKSQANASLARAQAAFDQADADAERASRLYESGIISEQERDTAWTRRNVAEADLNAAKADVAMAGSATRPEDLRAASARRDSASAMVGLYQAQIAQTTVTAPMDGILGAYFLEVGEMANPGDVVARLTSQGSLELRVQLPDTQLRDLQVGQTVELDIPAFRGAPPPAHTPNPENPTPSAPSPTPPVVQGTISYIAPAADAMSRLFEVRLTLPNSDGGLKSGMVASVALPIAAASNVIVLPEDAVLSPGVKPHVFVVVGNEAKQRPVVTGLIADGEIAILDGLSDGDQVIVLGQSQCTDGQPVAASPLPADGVLPSDDAAPSEEAEN